MNGCCEWEREHFARTKPSFLIAVNRRDLPVVADADRLRRFEQEAKTLAALNRRADRVR